MGLISADWELPDQDEVVPDWNALSPEQQEEMANRMEVYAAMIDRMDQNIGRVVDALEKAGELDNTLIIFLSDNGGARPAHVGYLHERLSEDAPVGSPRSFVGYGPGWASASNTPFRYFKSYVHEGGIATPFIAHFPALIKKPRLDHSIGHITDLMISCLYLAGLKYPDVHDRRTIQPAQGVSLVPLFQGATIERNSPLVFEHSGNKAVIHERLKLVMR